MASIDFVVPPQALTTLPVLGGTAVFPVGRVYCIGRNYRWAPSDPAVPRELPPWFMKPASAVVPAQGRLPYPTDTQDFCHEVELVVAIGAGGRHIDPSAVESTHIWGYAVGLDMTRRDLQQAAKRSGAPWEAAKAFDDSAPCTAMVPASLCGHPRGGAIWLSVNGQERQRGDLADLIWSVPELVAMLSCSVTLQPGDLIFTGTPAGVSALQKGDLVTGGIDGVGNFSLSISSTKDRP